MSDYISHELIAKILARLPIHDVVRSTSVCKSWYELITSSSFISLHLNLSISNTQSRVLVRFNALNVKRPKFCLHLDNETFGEIQKIQFPEPSFELDIVCGSSNGLLCCLDKRSRIMLWNPSLKKTLFLKPSDRRCVNSPFGPRCNVGFGFLPSTNDYKIVKISYAGDSVPPNVRIYSSCTCTWHKVDVEFSYELEESCFYPANLRGILHWIAKIPYYVGGTIKYLIVSFDLSSENFGALMIPQSLKDDEEFKDLSVSVLKESLCLIHMGDEITSIYIMKEYGIEESWERLYNIANTCDMHYFRNKGEILSLISSGSAYDFASYDPKANKYVDLGLYKNDQHSFFANAYVDSLFLIKGALNN